MTKYEVLVYRTGYSSLYIDIEAKNKSEAMDKAMVVAGDYEFSEEDADYEVASADEIEK